MEREIIRTQIAYRCPDCGTATVGFLGGLSAVSDLLRLRCDCSKSTLDIAKTPEGRVKLSVPCVYCKDTHAFVLSPEVIASRSLTKLSCPYSGMDICFMGDEEKIPEELERTRKELIGVMNALEAEELSDIQPEDLTPEDETTDPQVFDTLNFLLRDLEYEDKVKCPCEKGKYELRFSDEGVQVYCENCGASFTFYAKTPSMAEEYMSIDEIKLS